MKLHPHSVVVRPIVTEKGVRDQTENNTYPFQVHREATKEDVKKAIEEIFNVHVVRVRTINMRGKPRRVRHKYIHLPTWKKAIVKIRDGESISVF